MLETVFKDADKYARVVSLEDIVFLNKLGENIRMNKDNHLEMPLPFKQKLYLSNNSLAVVRVQHFKRRLVKDKIIEVH